jgi:hypothetical protein
MYLWVAVAIPPVGGHGWRAIGVVPCRVVEQGHVGSVFGPCGDCVGGEQSTAGLALERSDAILAS